MKTIGFTEVFYTLWEVGEPYETPSYYNGIKVSSVMKQDVIYCQNLSKDFEKAKNHERVVGQKYEIDLDLRGHSSFTRTIEGSGTFIDRENYYAHDCFSFGKMEGVNIKTVTDVWQLKRAYCEEKSARRRVVARRRLIELGELVRYSWVEKVTRERNRYDNIYSNYETKEVINIGKQHISDTKYAADYKLGKWGFDGNFEEEYYTVDINHKYATLQELADIKEREKSGHFFNNGEKVILELKEIKKFGFEGTYGWTSIRVYETKCGKIVKYIGSSPLDLITWNELQLRNAKSELISKCTSDVDKDILVDIEAKLDGIDDSLESIINPEFFKVSATIKHDNYRGTETKLLRMKIVK